MDILKKLKNEFTTSSSSSSGSTQDWYITAINGEGIKDEDFFSRSDPYLKIQFGGKHFRTTTKNNDRSPYWNETFHFQLKSDQSQEIVLTLMDDDFGFDDNMGSGSISKADLPQYSNEEKYFQVPIKKKDIISGLIHLRVKLIDNNMQKQQQSNQSSFQSTNIPYQQQQTSSQFSSGQQQPMSYGLNTQPQQYQTQPYQGQQYQNQPYQNQPYQNQPYQNQPYQNQPYQNQPYQNQPYQSQPFQNQPYQSQPFQNQPNQGQQYQGQQYPGGQFRQGYNPNQPQNRY